MPGEKERGPTLHRIGAGKTEDAPGKPIALEEFTQASLQLESLLHLLEGAAAVTFFGPDGAVLRTNLTADAPTGAPLDQTTSDEYIRKHQIRRQDGTLLTREELPGWRALYGEYVREEGLRFTGDDGRTFTSLVSALPIRGEGGGIAGSVVLWLNITPLHEAEERERQLQEESRRQREILERLVKHIPAAIAFLEGSEHHYTLTNQAYDQIARGKLPLEGRTVAEAWPEIADEIIPLMDDVLATGEPYQAVDQLFEIIGDRGPEERFFTFVFSPTFTQAGAPQGVMILALETTNEVRLRRMAEEERDRLRTLLESVEDEVWFVDEGGNLVLVSPSAAAALGFDSTEEMKRPLAELVEEELEVTDPDDNPRPVEQTPLLQSLKGYRLRGEEKVRNRRTGEVRWREYNSSPIYTQEGELLGAVAVVRDITARKRTQEAIRRYAEELERSNRDLEDFAFIASHDLQEPLRKIESFTGLLAERARDTLDETMQDYLRRTERSAERMRVMIQDLLDFSRVGTRGQPFCEVDLQGVLSIVLEDLELRIRQSEAIIESGDLPVIEADPSQMRQLFQNLIGNALKFHKKGEPPRLKIAASPPTASLERGIYPEEQVELIFQDYGIGFSPEYAEEIFHPFRRLQSKSEYEGSGIGLAICRKIVERHRGSIAAQGNVDSGAVFTVRLPVRQPASGNDSSED